MVKLFLRDGLGNQMFQYAFGRTFQIEHNNKKLCLITNLFENDAAGREYALSNFNIDESVYVKKFGDVRFGLFKLFKRTYMHFASKEKELGLLKRFYFYNSREYDYLNIINIKFFNNVVLDGQFQSFKWFDSNQEIIKNELKVKNSIPVRNSKLFDAINNSQSVCVHIRRGDYLSERWQHLNVCDYNYYYDAMKYIAENVDNPLFYIFSCGHNDIEWIKSHYDFSDFNVVYVDENNPDYEELRLMYSCKHFVISNSTFSWWAQYLSDNNNKIVCAPSVWSKRENCDYKNIYMPEWHIVEVLVNE